MKSGSDTIDHLPRFLKKSSESLVGSDFCLYLCRSKRNDTIMGKDSILKAYLSAYVFADGNYYVAYCPELDISAAGEDEADARQSLSEVLGIYFDDTISRGTLEEDLQRHGWRKRGSTVATPSPSTLLRRSTLRNILCKNEFHKYAIPMATL